MLAALLLAFPALFSIVNPITGAFIFREATADRTHEGRVLLARRIGIYSFIVMIVALWAGSYLLVFFGISMAALRMAGGLVLAGFAWERLGAPERHNDRKQQEASEAGPEDDVAFFPLTLPFTTGPGTIAVAVALGSEHPASGTGLVGFFSGLTLAALALSAVIALTYSYADRLGELLGRTGSNIVSRLSAFILFCIGVQLLLTGLTDALEPLLSKQ